MTAKTARVSALKAKRSQSEPLSVTCRVYICVLAIAATIFVPEGLRLAAGEPWKALAWMAFIAVTSFRAIPMLPRANIIVTATAPSSVAAAVLLPLPLAMLVKLVGNVNEREFQPGTSKWAIVFNRAEGALQVGAAAFAATLVQAAFPADSLLSLIAATVVAGIVFDCVNIAASTLLLLLRGLQIREAARVAIAPQPLSLSLDLAVTVGLALLIVVLYDQVAPASVLLLAFPLWLGFNAMRSARQNQDRAEELTARVRELEALNELGTDLLAARRRDQAGGIVGAALSTALETPDVIVSLSGVLPENLRLVKVPGAAGAAIGVPNTVDERSMEGVEAAAKLLGMALQRLDLEEELGEVERARAKLAGKIIEEGTRERSRLALEIHDDVLPYLAAAEIQADNVGSAIKGEDPARANNLARATREAVNGGISRLRQVLEALTNQIVVPGGLREALDRSLAQLRLEHGVDSKLDVTGLLSPLPFAVEILVVEIVRGCLSNVAKHAQADNVLVQLDVTDTLIAVRIHDDGRGFDPMKISAGHHGLALMQQRVELTRGRFSVRSSVTGGTTVEVEVPL